MANQLNAHEYEQNQKEKECFDRVIKCRTNKGQLASAIHQALVDNKGYLDINCECPDMIIKTDTGVIGIEHCQIDVLFKIKRKRAQSFVGIERSEIGKRVKQYKDEELLAQDIKSGKVLRPLLDLAEEHNDLANKFDYATFIDNYRSVCLEHNDKCEKYRNKLKEIAHEEDITLACLIEIPYPRTDRYLVFDKTDIREQAIKGLPMTLDILKVIEKMSGFDIVMPFMYSFDVPDEVNNYVCYYFLPQKVSYDVKNRLIRPFLSFDYPKEYDLKFHDDCISVDDEGNTTITASVKPRLK